MIILQFSNLFAQDFNSNSNVQFSNGDIFISSNGLLRGASFTKTSKSYDNLILGVYYSDSDSLSPKLKLLPFKTEGIYFVKFNNENGAIRAGDLITSSSIPGVGMKSLNSGVVLGVALEDGNISTGLVKTRILVQYVKQ